MGMIGSTIGLTTASMGLQAAQTGGLGILSSWYNNKKAAEREAAARRENFQYNELAAQAADARTRALYEDYESPTALLRQYKDAGLSPSLMFSGAGAGAGAIPQGAQGNGVTGVQPHIFGMDINTLDASQAAVNFAQAKKLNAETQTEEGTNKRGEAEIAEKLANAGLKDASATYTMVMTEGEKINNEIKSSTKENIINKTAYETELLANKSEQALYEMLSAKVQMEIDKETMQAKIEQVFKTNSILDSEKLLKNSHIAKNEAEINRMNNEVIKWQEEVAIGWTDKFIAQQNADNYEEMINNQNKYWEAMAKNLQDRLRLDKDINYRKLRLEYYKFVEICINNAVTTIFKAMAAVKGG